MNSQKKVPHIDLLVWDLIQRKLLWILNIGHLPGAMLAAVIWVEGTICCYGDCHGPQYSISIWNAHVVKYRLTDSQNRAYCRWANTWDTDGKLGLVFFICISPVIKKSRLLSFSFWPRRDPPWSAYPDSKVGSNQFRVKSRWFLEAVSAQWHLLSGRLRPDSKYYLWGGGRGCRSPWSGSLPATQQHLAVFCTTM